MSDVTKQDKFAQFLGIEIIEQKPGYAKVKLPVRTELLNGLDMVHGGVVFSLADYAFAVASNTSERLAVALSAHVTYSKPGRGPYLTAEAREVTSANRTGTYAAEICTKDGELIATFTGVAYYKQRK